MSNITEMAREASAKGCTVTIKTSAARPNANVMGRSYVRVIQAPDVCLGYRGNRKSIAIDRVTAAALRRAGVMFRGPSVYTP